jgi:hypothetical protein
VRQRRANQSLTLEDWDLTRLAPAADIGSISRLTRVRREHPPGAWGTGRMQNERDYQALTDAIAGGGIEAKTGLVIIPSG